MSAGIVNFRRGLVTGMIDGSSAWWVEGAGLVGTGAPSYRGFRYPVEIISHGVWLYYRFPLSFREVQEMMLARGVTVSHETIRQWCVKFGQTYAKGLRRRRPRPSDKWHLDEVFIKINGKTHYLWRAVDQDGNVLDILVQSRRNAKAAARFFRKLLKGAAECAQPVRSNAAKISMISLPSFFTGPSPGLGSISTPSALWRDRLPADRHAASPGQPREISCPQ